MSLTPSASSHAPTVLSNDDAFALILAAARSGRSIVPLFGSGLSIESGIPSPTRLGEFLAKLRFWSRNKGLALLGDESSPKWPDIYEITPMVADSLGPASDASGGSELERLQEIVNSELLQELSRVFHSDVSELWNKAEPKRERVIHSLLTQWRTVLRSMTQGRLEQVDLLYSTASELAKPSRAHIFASHLATLLGWKLVLSTTFDRLLEISLENNGLPYDEIVLPYRDALPQPATVKSRPCILKLLGDRASVRFSDVPDTDFDVDALQRFLAYFEPNSLFLVLGYRGVDRRVMGLVDAHVRRLNQKAPDMTSVLWVSRETPAPEVNAYFGKYPTVVYTSFGSSGLFLQELSARLRPSFPYLSHVYSPLPHLPPPQHPTALVSSKQEWQGVIPPVVVFDSREAGTGSSLQLADLARSHERSHTVIWCDLEEFPNVDALLAYIQHEIIQHDASLPPLVINGVRDSFRPADEGRDNQLHGQHQPAVSRLLRALRRGKYFVAIDSMNEFGRTEVAHDVSEPRQGLAEEYSRLCELLLRVAEQGHRLGESRIAFVLGAPEIPIISNGQDDLSSPVTPAILAGAAFSGELTAYSPSASRHRSRVIADGTYIVGGRYRIEQLLGGGSFGFVYKVLDTKLKTFRAAKILYKKRSKQSIDEAQKVVQLNHPNIAKVHTIESDSKHGTVIIMEYVDGKSLDECSSDLDLNSKLLVVAALAHALQHAHDSGILHCDVKPSNVIFTRSGIPKLVDFGVSLRLNPKSNNAGIRGTFPYMATEILDERKFGPPGPYSDQYSLGVMLFQLLAEVLPFPQRPVTELIIAVLSTPAPLLRDINPELPAELEDHCRKALEKVPHNRFERCSEFANSIERVARERRGRFLQTQLRNIYDSARSRIASLVSASPRAIGFAEPSPKRIYSVGRDDLRPLLRANSDVDEVERDIVGKGRSALDAINVLWSKLTPEHQAILVLAATFRRPRSLIALRRLGDVLMSFPQASRQSVSALLKDLNSWHVDAGIAGAPLISSASPDIPSENLSRILRQLHDAELLLRQEGGFYWMHSTVRDHIYRRVLTDERQGLGTLHSAIARFYYDVDYRSTRDILAFREFVSHEVLSVRYAPSQSVQVDRLTSLLCCLERERAEILARAQPAVVLGWVQAIRDVELNRIASRTWPKPDRAMSNRLNSLVYRMRAFLCDLAAEIHRRTTNYVGCIDARLEQTQHRLMELKLLPATIADQWLVDRLAQLSQGDFEQLKNDLLNELANARIVSRLKNAKQMQVVQRLVEHFYEIAVCMRGLHHRDEALQIFQTLATYAEEFRRLQLGTPSPASSLMNWALQVEFRCRLRIMDGYSATVHTWSTGTGDSDALRQVFLEYPVALKCLEKYPATLEQLHARHSCLLRNIVARAHYLQGRFPQAHLVLDSASSAVASAKGTPARKALAESELRRAECLLLEGDAIARDSNLHAASRVERSSTCLALAHSSLGRVREIMRDERSNVWQWTLLFLEECQLRHEELILTFLEPTPFSDGLCERRCQLASYALEAIATGLDNIHKDRRRWSHFTLLWWQLYVAKCAGRNLDCKESDGMWFELNQKAGLDWFLDRHLKQLVRVKRVIRRMQKGVAPDIPRWNIHGGDGTKSLRECVLKMEAVVARYLGLVA